VIHLGGDREACLECLLDGLVDFDIFARTTRTDMPKELDPRIPEAQHAIEVAASGGYFDDFMEMGNTRESHKQLEAAAMEILADQYPGLKVRVVGYPGSEHVDLQVVVEDKKR
jgi:hypothetical protein